MTCMKRLGIDWLRGLTPRKYAMRAARNVRRNPDARAFSLLHWKSSHRGRDRKYVHAAQIPRNFTRRLSAVPITGQIHYTNYNYTKILFAFNRGDQSICCDECLTFHLFPCYMLPYMCPRQASERDTGAEQTKRFDTPWNNAFYQSVWILPRTQHGDATL